MDAGRRQAHVVGEFRELQIAELPARDTPYLGKTVRDTGLRQQAGVSVVGFWERGKLKPAFPDTEIRADSVLVVAGTSAQIGALNELVPDRTDDHAPVLVINQRAPESSVRRRRRSSSGKGSRCTRSIGRRRLSLR